MADNFNLRSFLTENKLTKNAKLLKEGQQQIELFTFGYDFHNIEEVEDYLIANYKVASNAPHILGIENDPNPDCELIIGYGDTIINGVEVYNPAILQDKELMRLIELCDGEGHYEEEDDYDEEDDLDEATQGTDISGYWVMYGGVNGGVPQFIKMFPSEEEAQQALQDAPTTYGQHVLRGNWGIESAQDWLASGKELGPDRMGHPDRVPPKRLSPEERAEIRQLDFDARMERESVDNKKPIMKETKLTAKERRLVEMVQRAMREEGQYEGHQNADPNVPNDSTGMAIDMMKNGLPEGDEMADETVIPEYHNIDELLKNIDHGTNKVAEEHKIQEMKKIAEALRMKAKKMEESEHAAHISPKDLKQLATDATKLEKAAEKLKAAFDKKFNKKEKAAAAPKAEKVEALQENKNTMENFDLKKFLTENKMTRNSRMLSEIGRSIFGLETEGLGDRIGNAVSGVGAKLAGGNPAILQKMVTTAGIKVGVPIYSKDGKEVYVIKNIDYKTGDASVSVTVNNVEDQSKSKYESRVMTDSFKDILNAAPEEAQQLADREVEQVKRTFAQGDISYQKPA